FWMRSALWENFVLTIQTAVHGNVPRGARGRYVNCRHMPTSDSLVILDLNRGFAVRRTRPNSSLGILGKNNAQHGTVGAAAYAPAPTRRGGISVSSTWAANRPPFFLEIVLHKSI